MTEARCHTYYSSEYSNQFTYRHIPWNFEDNFKENLQSIKPMFFFLNKYCMHLNVSHLKHMRKFTPFL